MWLLGRGSRWLGYQMGKLIIDEWSNGDGVITFASMGTFVDGYLKPILAQHIVDDGRLEATLNLIAGHLNEAVRNAGLSKRLAETKKPRKGQTRTYKPTAKRQGYIGRAYDGAEWYERFEKELFIDDAIHRLNVSWRSKILEAAKRASDL